MRLPIDTIAVEVLGGGDAEPLRQFEEGKPRESWAPRTDTNGEVLWRVQLVALGDGEAEIIRVAVPGDPKVAQGEMVRVDGLTAQAWELDGRNGLSFRARAIRSAAGRGAGGREGGGVMAHASVALRVQVESVLADRSFVNQRGEPRRVAGGRRLGRAGDLRCS